mmetsp:Transcript_374/g.685  ORF Transcript_374/g.685 Transcript_374/m.685 type:complete len:220 (-) Transcript_374:201-860(-)|eukprot:CAMPEP_0185024312 /NCGR_PEP_ID=MMETSP1103-20130426/7330_1 /TAXON_ID=36769 /ORGANISM="Paraphysomonas bandaiensis, Strain Caron Lab Isolate" /LENGTH=219 /DNA_ID=CAMNT_0027557239 /DNA_START=49 /DNA_END=708 /DNA_ORIENTATION=+
MKRFGEAFARFLRPTGITLRNCNAPTHVLAGQRNISYSAIRYCNTDTNSFKSNASNRSDFEDPENDNLSEPPPDFVDDRPHPTQFRTRSIDKFGAAYGTGRRKTAVARVWIKQGVGQFIVNRKNFAEYFQSGARMHALEPFLATDTAGLFDVWCTVKGGGRMGQAGAVRHGISRAIEAFEPLFKPILKKHKLLTRDSRMVERKKAGFKKARKRKQWVKR